MAEEEAAARDVDMGDGDSDDSSSDEDVELDAADEARIMALEAQLEAAPTVYDTHVQVRHASGLPTPGTRSEQRGGG